MALDMILCMRNGAPVRGSSEQAVSLAPPSPPGALSCLQRPPDMPYDGGREEIWLHMHSPAQLILQDSIARS